MGRPRKPAADRAVNANKSGTTRPITAPDIEPDMPPPPFVLTDEAQAHWDLIVPRLDRKRVLDQVFAGELAILCECWGRYIRAKDQCLGNEVLISDKGGQYLSPIFNLMVNAESTYIKLSKRFGLDPESIRGVHSKQKAPAKRKTL